MIFSSNSKKSGGFVSCTLNGMNFEVRGGEVRIDGTLYVPANGGGPKNPKADYIPAGETKETHYVSGDLYFEGPGTLIVKGDVTGSIQAGGDVTARDVKAGVSAGGDVKAGDVSGNVSAGGDIKASKISGNVSAGGDITRSLF